MDWRAADDFEEVMNKADWLREMLDELYVYAMQSQDEAMQASIETIKDVYKLEKFENILSPRKVPAIH